ncbi:MAG: DsbA family protein [Pseudomonadota bacterium]
MNRFLPLILAAVVLVGGTAYMLMPRGGDTLPGLGAANAQTAAETVEIQDMMLGSADAPVTIIEYASYTCPHCRTFHQGPFKEIQAEYIDTGKVQFIYREVYFDRPGLWASLVARCGGEDRFFGISDLIYDGQSDWARRQGGPEIASALRQIGKVAGLSDGELDACFSDATKAASLYGWYQANAEADNITSTPSFIINGEKYSNMSMDEFRRVIDGELN